MKKTFLKNTLLIASGVMLATGFGILAAGASTSIEANITNLVQYLKEFIVTTDGTPSGGEFLHVSGSGIVVDSNIIPQESSSDILALNASGQVVKTAVSGGAESNTQTLKITLSGVALFDLYMSPDAGTLNPLLLIESPGPNKAIMLNRVMSRFTPGSQTYNWTDSDHIQIGKFAGTPPPRTEESPPEMVEIASDLYAANSNMIGGAASLVIEDDGEVVGYEDGGFVLTLECNFELGCPDQGDGVLDIYITYETIDL